MSSSSTSHSGRKADSSSLGAWPRMLGTAGLAMILISTHAEADFADLIAESPATGFLPKSELSADAIRRILDGRSR